jgi:hypothetical protein
MTIANLLVLPPPENRPARWAFIFDHQQAHLALLPKGRSRPSTLPLVLDPMQNENLPGSKWHLDHQQAHNNARGNIHSDQILRDSNLGDRTAALWWTFINLQEHRLMAAARQR